MIDVSYLIQAGLSMYSSDTVVKDTTETTEDGVDTQTLYETRTIQAAIDPTGGRRLEQIFGGGVSAGDIGIYTSEELYVGDMYDADEEGLRLQSFVEYQGFRYKVVDVSNWKERAGIQVFLGRRHVAQNVAF